MNSIVIREVEKTNYYLNKFIIYRLNLSEKLKETEDQKQVILNSLREDFGNVQSKLYCILVNYNIWGYVLINDMELEYIVSENIDNKELIQKIIDELKIYLNKYELMAYIPLDNVKAYEFYKSLIFINMTKTNKDYFIIYYSL